MTAVYVVMRNSDFTEGRGPMVMDSLWMNAKDAVRYAESIEPYGAKMEMGKYGAFAYGQFLEIKLQEVMDSYEDMTQKKENELREKALAKLSDKEKKVLGLK